ncbi:MAG TPA: hypothetical protein VJV03_14420 [Pyrinomonadaceae bacterium]|nr:hypothetical protein [Pyrinomonadaceae bacterium]
MNRRKMLTMAVLAGAAFALALGIASTQLTASAAPPAKVDLCHRTGNGSYQPISVSSNAAANHMSHGDVQQPNGAVPGSPGFVFDSQCNAVTWTYYVNAAPDISAQDPSSPGNLFVGTGIPAENFGLARNEALGIELGLMILYRQGPTVPSADNYADGVLNFTVASGPQSTANGSSGNNPGRAAWNFTFSVATGLNGATTDLNDYTFQLLYDTDAGPGTNYRTLQLEQEITPQAAGQSGFQWRDTTLNYVPISDDEGNSNVTQNSQNYGFAHFQAFLGGAYAPPAFAGPGQFDIILRALDGTQIVASNHIVVNVLP